MNIAIGTNVSIVYIQNNNLIRATGKILKYGFDMYQGNQEYAVVKVKGYKVPRNIPLSLIQIPA